MPSKNPGVSRLRLHFIGGRQERENAEREQKYAAKQVIEHVDELPDAARHVRTLAKS